MTEALVPAVDPLILQAAFPPFLINLALSESVGLYGLVLSLLSGLPAYSVAFGVGAIGLGIGTVFALRSASARSDADALDAFFTERGRKGMQISRYKGLGEMNADQLW